MFGRKANTGGENGNLLPNLVHLVGLVNRPGVVRTIEVDEIVLGFPIYVWDQFCRPDIQECGFEDNGNSTQSSATTFLRVYGKQQNYQTLPHQGFH